MNPEFKIIRISKLNIFEIKALWEKLNLIHLKDSIYFKDHYLSFTFEKRIEKFLKMDENQLFIEVVKNMEEVNIAYCISTIDNDMIGEIDSILVEDEYRYQNIGEQLVNNGIKWLKANNCIKIKVGVSYGHEVVFKFYQKMGFYPRIAYLELKEDIR